MNLLTRPPRHRNRVSPKRACAPKPSVWERGKNPLASSAIGNRFLFTGREWLADLRLQDNRNRYYQPEIGRWLTTDPIGSPTLQMIGTPALQRGARMTSFARDITQTRDRRITDAEMLPEGPNLYSYVANNPLNLFDPFGLEASFLGLDQQLWQELKAKYERNLKLCYAGLAGTAQAGSFGTISPQSWLIMEATYAGLGIGSAAGLFGTNLALGLGFD